MPRAIGSQQKIRVLIVALIAVSAVACHKTPTATEAPPVGIEALARPDLLALLDPAATAGMVSSYDRTGGNDDGFSGEYSFVRKEEGGLALADLEGPGVITRIHTPTPTDDIIEFTFNGETEPRIRLKVSELFDGEHAPFLSPLVWTGAGGSVSYVPLAFRKSCKILVRAETFQFIQINHVRYPEESALETYSSPPSDAFLKRVEEAGRIIAQTGSDVSTRLLPPGAVLETETVRKSLRPGRSVTLFETSRPGRLVGLRIGPAALFTGPDRDIVLRIFWDGDAEPAVNCPVGDFFGYSFGRPAMRSLFLGTEGESNYIYLPMPFDHSARIELLSERSSGPSLDVRAEIIQARTGRVPGEGRLYALWRRENPAGEGEPFTFLKTTGQGKIIGVILQAQGPVPGQTPFFEGDDRAIIDGDLAVPGTGSEDSFNGGWYDVPGRWYNRASFPLSGCLDYLKPQARTGGYRWFVADAYHYRRGIDFTIEHGPEKNLIPTDYASVVFFYSLESPPAREALLPLAARRVTNPSRIVFIPGWNVPLRSSSLKNASLTKTVLTLGKERVRVLSFRAEDEDIFGPHHLNFACEVPSAGRYRVSLAAVAGPDQGIVQLARFDRPWGESANLYASERRKTPPLVLGELDFETGENAVVLRLIGKDARSSGLGLDLAEIILERIRRAAASSAR